MTRRRHPRTGCRRLREFRGRRRTDEGRPVLRQPAESVALPPHRLSLPRDSAAARPASRRATGMRNGEQET